MQRQAILLLSLLLVAPEKAPCQQDMNSESLMDQAQNAVAQRTEQLTDEYAKELERLAKVYEQSGDLVAKAAANTELTRVQQTRQIAVFNFNQLPLGVAAMKEHLTGEGSFFLEIDTISGAVTHVTVSKSTGHAILDQAAIFALRQWRFAPHSAVEVSVPITFSMDSRSPTPTGKH